MDITMIPAKPSDAPFAASSQSEWIWSRVEGLDRTLLLDDRNSSIRGTTNDPCLIAVKNASGIWIFDHAGRRYMDMYGNNCHHIGYNHPRLIAALREQMDELSFVPRGLTNAPAVAFAETLANLSGWAGAKVVSARSGADAIEIALAVARANTGYYKTISFYDSYHGRSAGALSVGGRHQNHAGLGPLLPGAIHVPPYYRHGASSLGEDHEVYARQSLNMIRVVFEQERDICAVVGETIRNGPYVPPDWYWPEVRRLCDTHGALLILDEIATGLGKTGWLFNYQRFDIRPDILVLGKALGGATVPLAAVLVDERLDRMPHLNIGYFTHEKNPLCARAGATTLSILADEKLVANAWTLGGLAKEALAEMQLGHSQIREVRCAGLMVAVEFRSDCGSGGGGAGFVKMLQQRCIERGLLTTLPRGCSLTLSAPLTIREGELRDGLSILAEAIALKA